jgi:uncharacterized Zn finger protein
MSRYSYYGFAPYVSVAQKKLNAEKLARKLEKKGQQLEPVAADGSKLAATFWGKSWNQNLERYRDYENRLPRGRSYLRHGAVIDLKVTSGGIEALVSGSSLYIVSIKIKPLKQARWQELKKECSGKITSLIGLLQGKLPATVMEAVTKQDSGLFPEPKDISFHCSCPDSAGICKHCAAAVYGVGVRLDAQPELLFLLRGVDHAELITGAGDAVIAQANEGQDDILLDDIGGIFGIELDGAPGSAAPRKPTSPNKTRIAKKAATQPIATRAAKTTAKTAVRQVAAKKVAARKAAKKIVRKAAAAPTPSARKAAPAIRKPAKPAKKLANKSGTASR